MSSDQHHESFTITREYPHAVDRVWAAWAELDKKKAWFGEGIEHQAFEAGGAERSRFDNEMGEHVNDTRYFEIARNKRIVLAYSMSMNGTVHTVSLATITFAPTSSGTALSYTEQMCIIPPSDGKDGRQHGWNALLTALEDWLANTG